MEIFFQSHPDVLIASNTFINVATILQFEDMPLLEVGKFEPAGYSAKFHIFNSDGKSLVVVKGAQLYETEDGKKSNVRLVHEKDLTACELNGQIILELRRHGAAALKGWAELYAPEGVLIKAIDAGVSTLLKGAQELAIHGITMTGCTLKHCRIGIHAMRDGSVKICVP